ncbi:hypothetical protein EDB83DRAFT_198482 [Lactarius deliciosus]|nr:hypothetical protein EDB83DRAFT_198482 [Lactarius deliciosus]
MDRRVPPELLSHILLHLETFAKDAWPGLPDEAEADWQRQWHSGLDVDGLDALMPRYVPSLTLPQVPPFGKSFTAKAMADAVKLSRNTALARTSPMSTFLAAKGSTAWETSVKSRIETSVDEVPLGWRILEKEGKKDEKVEEVRKPTGLLAGLWGRRTSGTTSSSPRHGAKQPTADFDCVRKCTFCPDAEPTLQLGERKITFWKTCLSNTTRIVSVSGARPFSGWRLAPIVGAVSCIAIP